MKTYQLTKDKLEEFVTVLGKAIYSSKGWDEPTVILLDSIGDCEAFYQKLLYPISTEKDTKEGENINKLVKYFWCRNGYKYNWNFSANKVNYNDDILCRKEFSSEKANYFYNSKAERSENLSSLSDIALEVLIKHDELFTETLQLLSLPKNLNFSFLKHILRAIIVEEMLGCCLINHVCIFCRPPIIARNKQGRLHHSSGPAIEFPNGESYYYWKGRETSEKWIINNNEINREDLLITRNVEDRRILHEILGDEKFAKLLDLKVTEIDSYNGQEVCLMCTSSTDITIEEYLYFIKVICSSTGRQYHICIPKEAYNLGSIGALAWTFGMEAKDYQLLVET
jgi:hypothetical protein